MVRVGSSVQPLGFSRNPSMRGERSANRPRYLIQLEGWTGGYSRYSDRGKGLMDRREGDSLTLRH